MDGIAERVENGGNVQIYAGPVVPDIGHGQGDVFRERAGAVDADALRVGAQVTPPGEAIAAAPADDVAFAADDLAGEKVGDIVADFHNLADKLMPDSQRDGNRLFSPGVPVIDMQVGAADTSCARL